MKTTHLRLTFDVKYDLADETVEYLKEMLAGLVDIALNNGLLTGDSTATVEGHEYSVEVIQ